MSLDLIANKRILATVATVGWNQARDRRPHTDHPGRRGAYSLGAVAEGHQTLVLTPRDPGPDGCISCVTVHYFITVAK